MSPMTSCTVSDIQRITSGWGTGDWSESIRQHHSAHPMVNLKRQATTFLCRQLKECVDRGRFGRGFNWALLAFSLAENQMITDPGFQDCFRPSRVSEHLLAGLIGLQWRIYQSLDMIEASPRIKERMSSWACYSELYRSTRSDELKMLRHLHRYSQHSLHSLLVLADEVFGNYLMPDPNSTDARELEKPPFKQTYSQLHKEDVASGASYSLEAYNRIYGISMYNFAPFDDKSLTPTEFEETMLVASRLRELLDLEASVFRLDYKCKRLGTRKYIISPPTDRFGMALRFGYMRHGLTEYRFLQDGQKDVLSFRDLCSEWLKEFGGDTVRFVKSLGVERLRVEIPGIAARAFGKNILLIEPLFREERIEVSAACYEMSTDYETLTRFSVGDNLSIGDVIRISRVFRFFAFVRGEKLQGLSEGRALPRWNSVLGGIETNNLIGVLIAFGVLEEKAREYVRLFSWDSTNRRQFLDLQYTPLLQLEELLLIPYFTLASSNLVRSGLLTVQRRLYSSGEVEPLSTILTETFLKVSTNVNANVNYNFGDHSGEIDCIVMLGSKVYVFECKNTLRPCSSFEQRTMVDHIHKAAKQLDRIVCLWPDNQFRHYLGERLGWNLVTADLKTCVVLSTRLLSGANIGQHPIRQVYELENFVVNGFAKVSFDDHQREFRLWNGDRFTPDELDAYLSEDQNPVFGPVWEAFEAVDFSWKFEGCELVIREYGLDQARYLRSLGFDELAAKVEVHHQDKKSGHC